MSDGSFSVGAFLLYKFLCCPELSADAASTHSGTRRHLQLDVGTASDKVEDLVAGQVHV